MPLHGAKNVSEMYIHAFFLHLTRFLQLHVTMHAAVVARLTPCDCIVGDIRKQYMEITES
jgi:hypothetical protein